MREIKFRAWDYEDKKMWQVISISEEHWDESKHVLMCDFGENPLKKETDIRQSFTYELMQYTGLKDKNGKEIYEGDIVKIGDYPVYEITINDFTQMHVIDNEMGMEELWKSNKVCKIIGNIYENPELLGDSK